MSADRPFLQIPADIYRFLENKTPASGPAEPVMSVWTGLPPTPLPAPFTLDAVACFSSGATCLFTL